MLLQGYKSHGNPWDHLRSFLNALQFARDNEIQLAITHDSWAMNAITYMYMVHGEIDAWKPRIEHTLCVKIFRSAEEMRKENWRRFGIFGGILGVDMQRDLAEYFSSYLSPNNPKDETVSQHLYALRTLFHNHNSGMGIDQNKREVGDMCSGLNSLFLAESRSSTVYSVIHHEYLDGLRGRHLLEGVAFLTESDPMAALDMQPDYVKSILAPLGMLNHPIVIITDNQNKVGLRRLMADPDIGPLIQIVPEEACWLGGDITLGALANVFIGNQASSLSTFIARSRVSMGFGNNYLFRAKDVNGQWTTVCGDECLFLKN